MNFNIQQRLLFGFALVLAALLGVGLFSYFQVNKLEQTIALTQGDEALLGRAQSSLWELRYGFPQFIVVTGTEDRKKILDAEAGLYKTLEDSLKAYRESPGLTADEIAGYKTASDAWNAYKVRRAQWFTYIAEGKTEEAAAWRAQYTTPLGAATVKSLTSLIDTTAATDAARRTEQISASQQAKLLLLLFALLALAIGVAAAFVVARSMTTPLAQLQGALDKLGAGDYSARAQMTSTDEIGQVGNALDKLLDERLENLSSQAKENEQINNSVVQIIQAVAQVATNKDLSIKIPMTEDVTGAIGDAMNMLTSETGKVMNNVSGLSRQVSGAASAMNKSSDVAAAAASRNQSEAEAAAGELSQAAGTLAQLAQLAQKANDSAEIAVRTTRQALATVDKTVSGINESRDLIRETEKRIKRLGERSQEISQAVGLINSIAERTGILALNAAMQATAAGEAGRGFAIVADEVKRLSENAREATREITTLVSSIQSETSETVLAMNNAISHVVDTSRLADQAGSEMKGTQQATDDLASNVKDIAATSIRQARAGQSLQARGQAIQDASRETARQLTEQNQLTAKLLRFAEDLVLEVNVFKLPKSRSNA